MYFHYVSLNRYSALLYQCVFYAQIGSFGEKNFYRIFFCSFYFIFLLPLDRAVDNMSVSHTKEIWKYIWPWFDKWFGNLIILQKSTLKPKILEKVTFQHAPENPKKVCKRVCKSQHVCRKVVIWWQIEGREYELGAPLSVLSYLSPRGIGPWLPGTTILCFNGQKDNCSIALGAT